MYRYFFTINYNAAAVVASLLTVFTLIVALGLFRKFLNLPLRTKRRRRASARRVMNEVAVEPSEPVVAPAEDVT